MDSRIPMVVDLEYPDSDGRPMADNTLQADWIWRLFGGMKLLVIERNDIFVATNLLWYPVEGKPKIRVAPDIMVALGRPKGYRGSYKQWVEGGVGPQVAIEVLSPGNRRAELLRKRRIYQRFGVREYYVYDPYKEKLKVYLRASTNFFRVTEVTKTFTSPLLGVTFDMTGASMVVRLPDGEPFRDIEDMHLQNEERLRQAAEREADAKSETRRVRREKRELEIAAKRAAIEKQQLEAEAKRAAIEKQQLQAEVEAMRAKLKAAGIDPDAVS